MGPATRGARSSEAMLATIVELVATSSPHLQLRLRLLGRGCKGVGCRGCGVRGFCAFSDGSCTLHRPSVSELRVAQDFAGVI